MNPGKWHKLSLYQEAEKGNIVHCHLCPHNCTIRDGMTGICKTRVNNQGVLYSTAYGNPCSVSIDPIEKKPLFHYLPGEPIFSLATPGCNFHCLNCQNHEISQVSPQMMNRYDLMPVDVVQQAIGHRCKLIAFTYTEPTVYYEYMFDIAQYAHKKGVKTVLISNGYINQQPLLDLCPSLDAANIDLKCFDDGIYRSLCGGTLQPVLQTLKTLKNQGVWLEITCLIIPGYTDAMEMIESMCLWLVDNGFKDTPLHFSRFYPSYKLSSVPPTPKLSLIEARKTAKKAGISYVYIGNMPDLGYEHTNCTRCNRRIMVRNGYKIVENHVTEGVCGFCGEPVAGVWK
ncbi:MAG: AmmeMemoRadiSam system radical SAM enzyme [Bacteroidales bacterium]|nr:AmmeMemoRadiSam system radical SAM enzyme [Bacteroidales bacterium]